MKVLVLSDLHLDFWRGQGRDPLPDLDASVAGSVAHCIVAGDLTNKAVVRWPHAIEWLAVRFPNARIHVLPGNHDYYGGQIDREDKLAEVAASAGADMVQKRVLDIGGVRFLCCTLWTDFRLNGEVLRFGAMHDAKTVMNDYQQIRIGAKGYRRITPEHVARIHDDHRAWLEAELHRAGPGRSVVVTHHAPHPDCLFSRSAPAAAAYASDLSALIARYQPAAWIYGHTHRPTDFSLGDTRILGVSIGYPFEHSPGHPMRPLMILDTHDLQPGMDGDPQRDATAPRAMGA